MISFFKKNNTQRLNFDFASTTPVLPDVAKKMQPFLSKHFHNASALYQEGVFSKNILEESRTSIARILSVRSENITFTSGGTESNNIALLGLYYFYKQTFASEDRVPHFIVSVIEHPAILEVARFIEHDGGKVTYIPVSEEGMVNPETIYQAITTDTVCISIMYVSNEIGTIQPLRNIARKIQQWKKKQERGRFEYPYFHTDAAQAPNYLPINVESLGVDMMSLDSSKIYGPKGVGCLYKNHHIELAPILFGGGQESGIRPGTENIAVIAGFTEALKIVSNDRDVETDRMKQLQKYFLDQLSNVIEKCHHKITVNGSVNPDERIANNINICIKGINAEFEVIRLDEAGVMCAYTTACQTLGTESKSYVVEALNTGCSESALRFTMGRTTTMQEIDTLMQIMQQLFVSNDA